MRVCLYVYLVTCVCVDGHNLTPTHLTPHFFPTHSHIHTHTHKPPRDHVLWFASGDIAARFEYEPSPPYHVVIPGPTALRFPAAFYQRVRCVMWNELWMEGGMDRWDVAFLPTRMHRGLTGLVVSLDASLPLNHIHPTTTPNNDHKP